jgi:glutathione S-transferase
MQLVGMMDSPFVRRVAVSMRLMGLPYERLALSVFSTYEQFAAINPAVKAPTLITGEGIVLTDSNLILQYLEHLSPPARRLMPAAAADQTRALHLIGFALVACEKAVQIVYERNLRPLDRQHEPWVERVRGQMHGALGVVDSAVGEVPTSWLRPMQADVTAAVTWRFIQHVLAEEVQAASYPRLAAHSERAETLAEFAACPLE